MLLRLRYVLFLNALYLGHRLLGQTASLLFSDEQFFCSSTVCGCLLPNVLHAVCLRQFNGRSAVKQQLLLAIVLLYRADRPIAGCHPVGRGCGRTRSRVLGANARFPTEYDSKGDWLMRLAGHVHGLWPVSSRPCDCRMSRLGFHRATWEANFPHTAVDNTPPFKVVTTAYTIFHTHTYFFKIITHTLITHTTFTTYTTYTTYTRTHTLTHTSSHTTFHRTPSFTHNFHKQLFNCSILHHLLRIHHLLCLCLLSLQTTSSVLPLT